jgi:hypothetical protein
MVAPDLRHSEKTSHQSRYGPGLPPRILFTKPTQQADPNIPILQKAEAEYAKLRWRGESRK